jgi:hypothetical protein
MASLMELTYNKNQFARCNFPLDCFYFEIEMFAERNGRVLHSIFSSQIRSQAEKRAISETPRDLFVVQQALYVFS